MPRERRHAIANLGLLGEQLPQVAGRRSKATSIKHSPQQLVSDLIRLELHARVVLVGPEHQPRLQLEHTRGQDDELTRRVHVKLPARVEQLEIAVDDLSDGHLKQIDALVEHERQQQVKRPAEDLQIKLKHAYQHHRPRYPHPATPPHHPQQRPINRPLHPSTELAGSSPASQPNNASP